jgi:hypothetical protein
MYPVSGSRTRDDLGVQAMGGSAILHLAGEQDRWPDQVVATGSQQNLTSDALYGDRRLTDPGCEDLQTLLIQAAIGRRPASWGSQVSS